MSDFKLDTSKFDSTLVPYLGRLKVEDWPRAINKKLFFVARGAMKYTPKAERGRILGDLLIRTINAKRKDGTTNEVPLGYVLASKRASKKWSSGVAFQEAVTAQTFGGGSAALESWRGAVGREYAKIEASRLRGSGFLKVGWLSVMTELRSLAGLQFGGLGGERGVKLVGRLKSRVEIAKPGTFIGAVGIHLAQAAWDKKEGQYTKGLPALQRALDDEARSMNEHMEQEMRDSTEKFNREQR
jgi:hypothetical protein